MGRVSRGRGFGPLDGGEDFLAAAFASLCVMLWETTQRWQAQGLGASALQSVISQYMVGTLAAGIVAWAVHPWFTAY